MASIEIPVLDLDRIQARFAPVQPTVPINNDPGLAVDGKATPDDPDEKPVTEQELIETLQKWVKEDEDGKQSSQEDMAEWLRQQVAERPKPRISFKRIIELVETHAPNAPKSKPQLQSGSMTRSKNLVYPIELEPLVKSGVAVVENADTGPVPGHVLVYRCNKCGEFKKECCGPVGWVTAVRDDEKTLTTYGRQAVGLDPIKRPKPPKTEKEILEAARTNAQQQPWWNQFRSVDELEGNGTVKMFIENFLPEGVTLICGLPKEGKSFLAMSIAKALTEGKPLFGRLGFEVPEAVPVLYLAAESGDGQLKLRCNKFGITNDKTRFVARTLTQGRMFGLDSPEIESIVRALRPVIILESLIRFNEGNDEDDAAENRKLADALFRLIALGAPAVAGIHHSRKDVKDHPDKEHAVRGSGDGLAMTDAVWLVLQDEKLYQGNKGPNEIDVIGWGRDFSPYPMRLALTEKAPENTPPQALYAPGLLSCIDQGGDLKWVDKQAVQDAKEAAQKDLGDILEKMIQVEPGITLEKLAKAVQNTVWTVASILRDRGWTKPSGKAKKGKPKLWQKAS